MKKVLLVNPIYNRFDIDNKNKRFSIGLTILQKEFRENKFECDILDLNFFKEEFLSCTSYSQIIEYFFDLNKYSYIGFTSFSNNFINALLMSIEIKKINPNIKIFFGGAHVTSCAEDILNNFDCIDFICLGEGEKVIPYLVDFFNNNILMESIPNIAYFNDEQVKFTSTLQILEEHELHPIPVDFEIIGVNTIDLIRESISIEGGRGCPFNCVFCSTNNFWQRKNRMKTITNLIEEINDINRVAKTNFFHIIHDLFTLKRDKLQHFTSEMKKNNYAWTCSARIDTINQSLLDEMYESGCKDIFFGIETGDPEIQKVLNKNLNLKSLESIFKHCNEKGYMITVSFIIGFPFENKQNLDNTLDIIFKYHKYNNIKFATGILTPEIGTNIYLQNINKIIFDKYYVETNYDFVGIDKDKELQLIEKFPSLFSHFYYIKNENFTIHGLRFIEKVIRFLAINYYKTFTLISYINNNSIISSIENIVQCELSKFTHEDYKNIVPEFETLLESYTSKFESLSDLFNYENQIKDIKLEALKYGYSKATLIVNKDYLDIDLNEIDNIEKKEIVYDIEISRDENKFKKLNIKISKSKPKEVVYN